MQSNALDEVAAIVDQADVDPTPGFTCEPEGGEHAGVAGTEDDGMRVHETGDEIGALAVTWEGFSPDWKISVTATADGNGEHGLGVVGVGRGVRCDYPDVMLRISKALSGLALTTLVGCGAPPAEELQQRLDECDLDLEVPDDVDDIRAECALDCLEVYGCAEL